MNWEQFKSQFTVPFILDLVVQGGAWYVVHKLAGQTVTPPTVTDPTNLQQVGRAAVHAFVVGKKRKQNDEAIYAGLICHPDVSDFQRDTINAMLALPVLNDNKRKDFRYIIALQAALEDEDFAVRTLRRLGSEPTPEDALRAAKSEGLFEPEDPTQVQKDLQIFWEKLRTALTAAWQHSQATVVSTGAHLQAKQLFENELGKLFK